MAYRLEPADRKDGESAVKQNRLIALLLCASLCMGCGIRPQDPTTSQEAYSLPSLKSPWEAPIGDAGLAAEAVIPLYLPSRDGQRLLTVYETLPVICGMHPAEAAVRALLAHPGTESVRPVGGSVSLTLAGSDPVEISGGVCTVNLSASAMALSQQDFYTACLALTSTLCSLEGVRSVNILVAGRAVSMDAAGYLPLGTLTPPGGQDLPVLWEQLAARRIPVGEEPGSMPLSAGATLYFPLEDGSGVVPEVRAISFPGQHPQQLILQLMAALSEGPRTLTGVSAFPDWITAMPVMPVVTELNSGGRRVTLCFPEDMKTRIAASGTDASCCFAALVMTLTTFVPALEQVCIILGEDALTSLYNSPQGSHLFPGGVHTRRDYSGFLMAQTAVYQPDGQLLTPGVAVLPYRSAHSPRSLLTALSAAGTLPQGLTDADILGLAVRDGTLLIHLSARYQAAIHRNDGDQRLMAYAVVNTLCEALQVRRVRFFFGGEVPQEEGGLMWGGEFLYNPGLIRR